MYWIANGPDIAVRRHFTESDWNRTLVSELQCRRVNVVFDVGANSGQYAAGLRAAGFEGRIISFEPLSGPFAVLERAASGDPLWDCRQCALGDHDGTIEMNVAGNAGASSSLLPMLKSHRDVYPEANYVGTEDVAICRLDSIAPALLRPGDVAFLKADVQGFEKHVIAGGESTVNRHCTGVQLELTFVPLYEGGMLVQEALDLVQSLGLTLRGYSPFFIDVRDGRVLQADGVFLRGDE